MKSVQNNPYRITGLLVGSSAREQERQIKRLRQYIDAEQEPPQDFSFPALGHLHRTPDGVAEATSKLNLDSDRINAALFWFWKGNSITDEPAFEAIKDGDTQSAIDIWSKLADNTVSVTRKNASALHNLSTLYLTEYGIDEETLNLKLRFLESDFISVFVESVTDATFRISGKELQTLFLNGLVQSGAEVAEIIEAISDIEFIAKDDFIKNIVQKLVEPIEQKIETAKSDRKNDKAKAYRIGLKLYEVTQSELKQLKGFLGPDNIKYSSIADKVANEILQCGIEYFNDSKEKRSNADYNEAAMELAKLAESIAVGQHVKERVKDNIRTLEEMKDSEILKAIELLQSVKSVYETNERQILVEVKKQELRLGYNQSINWSKVMDMIEKSVDWDKVVELVKKDIPKQNIDKIRFVQNQKKINEYKTLTQFLKEKLSHRHWIQVEYLWYWETPARSVGASGSSNNTYSPTKKSSDSWMEENPGCLALLAMAIIIFLISFFSN